MMQQQQRLAPVEWYAILFKPWHQVRRALAGKVEQDMLRSKHQEVRVSFQCG